jgi:hypothetical protein
MTLGLSLPTFTLLHALISLIGIAAGLVVALRMVIDRPLGDTNVIFLVATIATTVTGFLFPFKGMTPALAVGAVSAVILAVAVWARYVAYLAGRARAVYVVAAIAALYLNFFVAVVQSFQKIVPLKPLAGGPVFIVVQVVVLLAFIAIGYFAVKRWTLGRL